MKRRLSVGVRVWTCGAGLSLVGLLSAAGCGSDSEGNREAGDSDAGTMTNGGATGGANGVVANGSGNGSADASANSGATGGVSDGDGSAPTQGSECGNGIREAQEECDDGNASDDDACLNDCKLACGDGVVSASEACDTAIAAGEPGACPTACDSDDPCITATLTGTGCDTACEETTITTTVTGDGCCPEGATTQDDGDCTVECGNGVVESGESCDTAITAGTGACPTTATCDDSKACTVDAVADEGTCNARCDHSQTAAADLSATDGCCPPGADSTTDADCDPLCGNGELDSEETCDTAIDSGEPGACPTSCPSTDSDPCTLDELVTDDPCNPECVVSTIQSPSDGDSCCPDGANALNDSDCQPECGNGVVEGDEQCDEESARCDSSTCEWIPTAFRITSLEVVDPHLWVVNTDGGTCDDVTATVNGAIASMIDGDGDDDGALDLSLVVLFRPLDQQTSPHDATLLEAECPAPAPASSCGPLAGGASTSFLYNNSPNGTDPCLGPLVGTTTAAYGPIAEPSPSGDGCWVSNETTLSFTLAGIPIVLEQARGASEWSGDPATGLVNGLLRGFMSESVANSTEIPNFGTLADVLPGPATDACSVDDRDTLGSGSGADGGTDGESGWWFYLHFEAEQVTWTGD